MRNPIHTLISAFVKPGVRMALRLRGTYLDPSVQIVGWRHVSIGSSCAISEGVWFNVNHRSGDSPRIVIGDNSHVGRRNFFSAGPVIALGAYFFSGIDCRFLGCGHEIADPRVPFRVAGLTEGAPIEVETNCWLTTAVTVLEGVRIGRGSTIGANSVVNQSLPPFCVALGSPCRVVRRFDFRSNTWVSAQAWRDSSEPFQPTEEQYLELLRASHRRIPPALCSASTRFGWIG